MERGIVTVGVDATEVELDVRVEVDEVRVELDEVRVLVDVDVDVLRVLELEELLRLVDDAELAPGRHWLYQALE